MSAIQIGEPAPSGPAFFSFGFRPFFFAGAVFAGIAIPVWIGLFTGGVVAPAPGFDPMRWHAHEMVFGYLGAILAGFLLTAIPNWTGRKPVAGWRLAGLFSLWLLARIVSCLQAHVAVYPAAVMAPELLFWLVLVAIAAREVASAKAIHNLPVVAVIGLLGVADLISFLPEWTTIDPMLGGRLALALIAGLISLIGGRITPAFTRNWLVKAQPKPGKLPPEFNKFDKVTVGVTVVAMLSWAFQPAQAWAGALLLTASALQAIRLARWQGQHTLSEPLVVILHLGYLWLVLALLGLGLAALVPTLIETSQAMHALTAGTVGTMTLAVMTRATLGHTGRPLTAGPATRVIYLLVTLGALLRVSAAWLPTDYSMTVAAAGMLWAGAFLLYAVSYGPALFSPRIH
jgi:uncharacterized protein involved in response to NO